QRYGGRVDFTSFLAGLTIDEILALTVGALARHITHSLNDTSGLAVDGGASEAESVGGAQGG
ncbi:MAG: hypothetical protein ACRDZ8_14895, partial [Acidimicrobiales bacterium]